MWVGPTSTKLGGSKKGSDRGRQIGSASLTGQAGGWMDVANDVHAPICQRDVPNARTSHPWRSTAGCRTTRDE